MECQIIQFPSERTRAWWKQYQTESTEAEPKPEPVPAVSVPAPPPTVPEPPRVHWAEADFRRECADLLQADGELIAFHDDEKGFLRIRQNNPTPPEIALIEGRGVLY